MKISKRQLRRIISEALYGGSNTTGDYYEVIAEEAYSAYENGVRRIGDFLKIVVPMGLKQGFSRNQIMADARKAWKLEKEARRPFDR